MKNGHYNKTARQIKLYYCFSTNRELSARNLMLGTGIKSRRTFERDITDLRDSGLMHAVYDRHSRRYKISQCEFNEEVTGARKKRLKHLYRLGTLLFGLTIMDIDDYAEELDMLEENAEEDPEHVKGGILPDIAAEYENLFPGLSKRTQQRDFQILNSAGDNAPLQNEILNPFDFQIIYNKKYKTYVLIGYDQDY